MSSVTRQVWIGQCELYDSSGQSSLWQGESQEKSGYAVAYAQSESEFRQHVLQDLKFRSIELIKLVDAEPLLQYFSRKGMNQSLVGLAQGLSDEGQVEFHLFDLYDRASLQPGHSQPVQASRVNAMEQKITCVPCPPSGQEINWDLLLNSLEPLWAIIDGVSWPEIQSLLAEHLPLHACLYSTQDSQSRALAPWLIQLEPENPITHIVQSRSHASHAVILFQSRASIKDLRDHFRLFTLVWTPADTQAPIYFRYYDSRVLTDLFSALEPWKQTRFCAPVSAFYVPLSPSILIPEWAKLDQPITFQTPSDSCQGRLLKLMPSDNIPDSAITGGRAFRISQKEFEQFGYLNTCRQQRNLACELWSHYGDQYTSDIYLRAAALAPKLGTQYALTSTKQVKILAQCLVLFGEHFPQAYPEAQGYLNDHQKAAHERIEALWQWVSKGLLLQQLESDNRQQGHELEQEVQPMETLFSPQTGGEQ
ncbi:MAG: DUF4123 domain-containing protein [Nitrincola lacisaponensis]|uniref:DUF4123 domain-containing protein n=1 Tax=Nitrincola lacisaponensis TaxID=267850 RepID=UPI00391D8671